MRLIRARIQYYRSIKDSGEFALEESKTALVGPNEAGKTAVLKALQALNPPKGEGKFNALRDFPRSEYSKIEQGQINPKTLTVSQGVFSVDDEVLEALKEIDPELGKVKTVEVHRRLDNSVAVTFPGVEMRVRFNEIETDIGRLRANIEPQDGSATLIAKLDAITSKLAPGTILENESANSLVSWLEEAIEFVTDAQQERYDRLKALVRIPLRLAEARNLVLKRLPVFVYYHSFFRVRSRIHLRQLADREDSGDIDLDYDFGSLCLLNLLGLSARKLADMGRVGDPDAQDRAMQEQIQDQLDERMYRLNAATVELTKLVRTVWGDKDVELDIRVDGDYLKVVARDDLGVEVELDQRSEGFQWLVSFYIVFKSQSSGDLANSILLLDEPGMSLHALKQQEFRHTLSLLGADNQTIYTTHSPFMVGPDELPIVRIVDMKNRATGTRVHEQLMADDPASLFPLQAAFGYLLSQTLFGHDRNLVLEGITDYFYVQAISDAFRSEGVDALDERIALVPAGAASKVVYFSVLLHSQRLKVAALLDSDREGDAAANQDNLVALLSEKRIHRTKDFYKGPVQRPQIEDSLRESLIKVAKDQIGWDIEVAGAAEPGRSLLDIFGAKIAGFSKYRLSQKFIRWLADNGVSALTSKEREFWSALFGAVNKALK